MSRNKARGNEFELKIAKLFSRWWNPSLQKKDYFWRTAGSGCVATIRNQQCMQGDVIPVDPEVVDLFVDVVIECKKRRSIDILSLLDRKQSELCKLFEEQSQKYPNKIVLLVVQRDYAKPLLCTKTRLQLDHIYVCNRQYSFYIYDLEEVMRCMTLSDFLNVSREQNPK